MANDVQITMTADARAVLKAFQEMTKSLEQMHARLEAVERTSTRTRDKFRDTFDAGSVQKQISALGKLAATYVSISSAIGLIKREMASAREEMGNASSAQVSWQKALAQTIRNANGTLSPMELESALRKMAVGKSPIQQNKLAEVVGSVFSAKGVTNKQEAMDVLNTVGVVSSYAPELETEDLAMFGGAVQDLRSVFKITAEEAVGYMQKIGGLARTTKLLPLAEHVTPSILAANKMGASQVTAGAGIATFSNSMADFQGAISSLAWQTFVKELEERRPDLKTFEERLNWFRQNPKAVKAFFEGGMINGKKFPQAEVGRGRAIPTIRAMFDPNSMESQNFENFKQSIGTSPVDWKNETERTVKAIEGTSAAQIESIERSGEAIVNEVRLLNRQGAMQDQAEKLVTRLMKASGLTEYEADAAILRMRTRGDNVSEFEAASQVLRAAADNLREDPFRRRKLTAEFLPMQALLGMMGLNAVAVRNLLNGQMVRDATDAAMGRLGTQGDPAERARSIERGVQLIEEQFLAPERERKGRAATGFAPYRYQETPETKRSRELLDQELARDPRLHELQSSWDQSLRSYRSSIPGIRRRLREAAADGVMSDTETGGLIKDIDSVVPTSSKVPEHYSGMVDLLKDLTNLGQEVMKLRESLEKNTKATEQNTQQTPAATDRRTGYQPTSRALSRGAT